MRHVNWPALGTIAELIGAAGVVISVFYVATEIRQNTRQVEEANRIQRLVQLDAAFENFSRIRMASAGSAEVTRIWLTGLDDLEALDAIERARFESMLGEMLNASQVLYARIEEGGLYPEVWEDLMLYLGPLMRRPGVARIWNESKDGYRSAFVVALERAMDGPSELAPEAAESDR